MTIGLEVIVNTDTAASMCSLELGYVSDPTLGAYNNGVIHHLDETQFSQMLCPRSSLKTMSYKVLVVS